MPQFSSLGLVALTIGLALPRAAWGWNTDDCRAFNGGGDGACTLFSNDVGPSPFRPVGRKIDFDPFEPIGTWQGIVSPPAGSHGWIYRYYCQNKITSTPVLVAEDPHSMTITAGVPYWVNFDQTFAYRTPGRCQVQAFFDGMRLAHDTDGHFNICGGDFEQRCEGASIYWYDACQRRRGGVRTCGVGEVCQASGGVAQCVGTPTCNYNGACDPGESAATCCVDCPCDSGQVCVSNRCQVLDMAAPADLASPAVDFAVPPSLDLRQPAVDLGAPVCTEPPRLPFPTNWAFGADAAIEVPLFGNLELSASAENKYTERGGCAASASLAGSLLGRFAVGGVPLVAEGKLEAGGMCEWETSCQAPPRATCDPETMCCSVEVGGSISLAVGVMHKKKWGDFDWSLDWRVGPRFSATGTRKVHGAARADNCRGDCVTIKPEVFGTAGVSAAYCSDWVKRTFQCKQCRESPYNGGQFSGGTCCDCKPQWGISPPVIGGRGLVSAFAKKGQGSACAAPNPMGCACVDLGLTPIRLGFYTFQGYKKMWCTGSHPDACKREVTENGALQSRRAR